jgi:hypothetical protein
MKKFTLIITLFLLLATTEGFSQVFMSPRGLSFANTYATQSRGSDAIGWNPANLGFDDNGKFSMTFGVFPLVPLPSLQLSNNAVSAGWYNTYFTKGGYLGNAEKAELLSVFPATGWNMSPSVQMRLIGLSFGHTGIALEVDAAGNFTLPRAIPEFIFNGNKFDESMDLSTLHGEFQTVATLNVAHGYKLKFLPNTYFGLNLKGIFGGGYARTESVEGAITSHSEYIEASGDIVARYAAGGYGYAFDLGLATRFNDMFAANISVNNLLGTINWLDYLNETIHYTLDFTTEDMDFENVDFDSLMSESISNDTSYSTAGFSTPYPAYAVAGVQLDLTDRIHFYANYRQGFTDRLDTSVDPIISFATELQLLRWFPIRFGVAHGGKENFRWGGGFGFEFKHYSMIFGFSQTGGFYNSSTGFAFSFGQELRF